MKEVEIKREKPRVPVMILNCFVVKNVKLERKSPPWFHIRNETHPSTGTVLHGGHVDHFNQSGRPLKVLGLYHYTLPAWKVLTDKWRFKRLTRLSILRNCDFHFSTLFMARRKSRSYNKRRYNWIQGQRLHPTKIVALLRNQECWSSGQWQRNVREKGTTWFD